MGDIPRGDLAVYAFIEMIALGFVLESVSAFRAEKWISATALMLIGLVCFVAGIKGPWLKSAIAGRLPGAKLKREIEALRRQSAETAAHRAAQHTQEMSALREQFNSTRPTVVPVLFGALPRPDRSSVLGPRSNALTLTNDGRSAAYDISIPPFSIGDWSINFDPISRLGVDERLQSSLWVWRNGQGSDDLVGPLIQAQGQNDGLGTPVPFEIVFRDSDQNWFTSSCELRFCPTDRSVIDVRYIRREPHTT